MATRSAYGSQRVVQFMRSEWIHYVALGLVAIACAVLTSLVFAPGGMNPDTRWQMHQVLGNEPLSDWHPPIMTVTWIMLYDLTGHLSILLYLQVCLMFLTGFGLAIYLYLVTKSRIWSYSGLAILLLPHIFTYIGVLWKDTQMAVAFFFAIVCFLLSTKLPKLRWTLFVLATLAVGYGCAVRKNAFFALLPLLYLLSIMIRKPRIGTTRRKSFALFVAVAIGTLFLITLQSTVINSIFKPIATHQVSQVMLDDIIFTVPGQEISSAHIDPTLKKKLLTAKTVCKEKNAYEDAYWRCYGRGKDGIYTAIEHVEAVQSFWLSHVVTRPDRYLIYRTQTFAHLLFDNYTEWDGATIENDFGYHTKFKQLNDAGKTYVELFGVRNLDWTFTGWFWLAVPTVLILNHRNLATLGRIARLPLLTTSIVMLSLSSVIYIIGYFPIVPANHFRYVYWPALATSVSLLLIATGLFKAWVANRQTFKLSRTVKESINTDNLRHTIQD